MLEVKTKWLNLDEAFAELEKECEDVVRGITVSAWKATLRNTPQWSGGLAASWSYCLNTPQYDDRTKDVPVVPSSGTATRDGSLGGPFKKGDFQAIDVANKANLGRDQRFRLGDRVYFTNGASHGDGYYAGLIESGQVRLRAVNLPGRPAKSAFDMIEARYGTGVSRRAAAQLKHLSIGDHIHDPA